MNDPSDVLDRPTAEDVCGCFADAPPLPMGCAVCGHAPYAHGCPGRPADHEYVQPTGELMATRLEARRLGIALPALVPSADEAPAEVIPLVPAQGRPEPPAPTPLPKRPLRPKARTAAVPPRRDDSRRPVPRPVENREERAARLALARDPRTRQARLAGQEARSLWPAKPPAWPLRTPEHQHQTLRPGLAVALGRGHSPDTIPPRQPSPWWDDPYRREAAA